MAVTRDVVWIVEKNMDQIKQRDAIRATKEQMIGEHYRRYEIFASEQQAYQFMAQRALDAVDDAERELQRAKARCKKCTAKLNEFYARSQELSVESAQR